MRGVVALPVEGNVVTVPRKHVAIERVVANVGLAASEPFNLDLALAFVEIGGVCASSIPLCFPVESVSNIRPELVLCLN